MQMKTKVKQIYQKSDGEWLHDHQQLWRYVPYKTMFLYLKGKAYIPSVEKLREQDPFEGDFPFGGTTLNQALRDRCDSQHESVIKWIHGELCTDNERKMIKINRKHGDYVFKIYQRRYLAFLRRTRYAWCWFASGIESALMWNSYGRDGVAIGTTVGKLKSALETSGHDFVFGRMAYRSARPREFDSADPKNHRLLTMPHFFKREEYKGEQEVRFVTTGPGKDLVLSLPPDKWITEFRLHPKLLANEAEAIKGVVKKVLPKIKCEPSDLLKGLEQSILNVAGMSHDLDESYFRHWKEGNDGIASCLKSDRPAEIQVD